MIAPRVPPTAFIVPMIAVCSATRVVTVLRIRKPLMTTATMIRMRNSEKTPSIACVRGGECSWTLRL